MTLRPKLGVRAAGAVAVLCAAAWLLAGRQLRALPALGAALLVVAWSFRASIIVRNDVVSQRGLLGWRSPPVRLDELAAVSLRLRPGAHLYLPLTVELCGARGAQVRIACWAWEGWRELAHRAGHFARRLDARRDEVTDHHLACTEPSCAFELHAAEVAGEQRSDAAADGGAGTVLDMGRTDPSLLRVLGGVGLMFVLGFLVGYYRGWIQDEPDVPPLETGLAIGGFYAILLGGGLACARIYHRVRPPDSPPSGLAESGWVRSARALTPVRVAVSIVGLLALLAILLFALLPYGAVTVGGEENRCGSPLVQMIRPDDGQLAPRASRESADGALRGNQACLTEAKHRRRLIVELAAMTLVGVGSVWLVSGGKGKERPRGRQP